mmetsp:Transcript_62374/g.97064  ORF Transcript_62374/g.97064 Transcript_62374/m.97064 type:complete len:699 (-) Transcript_62374:53-2149(-)
MEIIAKAVVFLALLGHASSTTSTPMARVVELLSDLKAKVESDGSAEQASYDEYACWCEKTLQRKAAAISEGKELIAETEILIQKLKGEIASHGAEITQLNKDIAENIAAQKEATEVRKNEYDEYNKDKTESEQCIGALEAAIKVLTGAGAQKGFLDTSVHQAQLLSVAAQMRTVLRRESRSVSEKDLELVKNFIAKPEEYLGRHASAMSATQVGQNPFGDYAPQSTQIQGILKGMYDAFTADLEKDNANEANSQKIFEALMATKKQELKTLEATLQKQETDAAAKTKKLKESESLKDDTIAQVKADEAFFADTKAACKSKAEEWSVRTRLRTEELNGMIQAIKILSSESAKKTFENATTTFLQFASVKKHAPSADKAFAQLKILASNFKSMKLAKIAAAVKLGGHFDKVIGMIDEMIGLLRKEEAEDIVHRDLCENTQNANKNELADLDHDITKAGESLKRMENTKSELESEIESIEGEIESTKKEMAELLDFRNKEEGEFKQALLDDHDAVGLIREAMTALKKFYKENKIPLNLRQDPEYTHDPDKAPETTWKGADYGGRKSESQGIIEILAMLAEDLENEMSESRKDDADAQAKYEEQNTALQKTLDAQTNTKISLEEQLAALEEKIDATESYKSGKENDESAENGQKKALETDCAWVKTHFESRREKRKTEIQGLVDAKAFLAGVDAGEDPLPLS